MGGRASLLAVASLVAALAGCAKINDPVSTCVEHDSTMICGRGPSSCTYLCLRYAITCNAPLVLSERDGKLECHMPQGAGE